MTDYLLMPTDERSVFWAEEAMAIADVLRELADKFDGIDNGRCTVCRVGHRLWKVPGKVKGLCDYKLCLSHRIGDILERYEQPSEEILLRIREGCLQKITSSECFCGVELEAGLCPNGHDPLPAAPSPEPQQCTWTYDPDGYWATSCGDQFCITEGSPVENRMRYCHYCSGRIITDLEVGVVDSGK